MFFGNTARQRGFGGVGSFVSPLKFGKIWDVFSICVKIFTFITTPWFRVKVKALLVYRKTSIISQVFYAVRDIFNWGDRKLNVLRKTTQEVIMRRIMSQKKIKKTTS